jgi:CRISPR/Cas system-associated exonuclease Cas4 (RecB family)
LRVTDHKTGKVADAASGSGVRVGKGELLQPLLYALVARDRLQAPVGSGRLFYCTRRGDFRSVDVPVDEDGVDALDVVLDTIDGAVEHATLPAAPKDGACRWCDYRLICGPREERRTARKQDDLLRPLRRVRSIR